MCVYNKNVRVYNSSTYEGSTMPQQEDFSTVTSMTEQETMEKS